MKNQKLDDNRIEGMKPIELCEHCDTFFIDKRFSPCCSPHCWHSKFDGNPIISEKTNSVAVFDSTRPIRDVHWENA